MATQYLKCTFESGIVLLATSNTQGRSEVLDFVPGSKFVGVAAGLILKQKVNKLNFDTLLDGTIRFGDATLYKDGKITYKAPLSYHKPKTGEQKVYNHHYLTTNDFKEHQYVQVRHGYITEDGQVHEPIYHFRQKSTRNTDTKEMYGYDAAQREQEWVFAISSSDEELLAEVVDAFVKGQHRIGKSKRVEYGKVTFERLDGFEPSPGRCKEINGGVFLYVQSRLALFDPATGQPTFEPTPANLGLADTGAQIDWEKTQIRTTTFSPYNTAQQTQTYERILIEKGSVIALSNVTCDAIKEKFDAPIGAFVNEGLGEILVNPSFLEGKEVAFKPQKIETLSPTENIDYAPSDPFIDALVSKAKQKAERERLMRQVHAYVDASKGAKSMNSQWGVIRSIVAAEPDEKVYEAVQAFIKGGISAKEWDKEGERLDAFIQEEGISDIPNFLLQVAQQMQLRGKANTAREVRDAV